MTAEEQQKMKDGLSSIRLAHQELQKRFGTAIWLRNYYKMRYDDTRVALIECRLGNRGLEDMVAALQERLGDKGPDLKLGDDFDVV